MKNTRDHAEIPELLEVLGLEDEDAAGSNGDAKPVERKGTGLSLGGRSRAGTGLSHEKKLGDGKGSLEVKGQENAPVAA